MNFEQEGLARAQLEVSEKRAEFVKLAKSDKANFSITRLLLTYHEDKIAQNLAGKLSEEELKIELAKARVMTRYILAARECLKDTSPAKRADCVPAKVTA